MGETDISISSQAYVVVGGPVPLEPREGRHKQRYNQDGARLIAGCIPIRYISKEEREMKVEVCMISARVGSALLFPKGGWEEDEELEAAASRETLEEAGVRGRIQGKVLGPFEYYSNKSISKHDALNRPRNILSSNVAAVSNADICTANAPAIEPIISNHETPHNAPSISASSSTVATVSVAQIAPSSLVQAHSSPRISNPSNLNIKESCVIESCCTVSGSEAFDNELCNGHCSTSDMGSQKSEQVVENKQNGPLKTSTFQHPQIKNGIPSSPLFLSSTSPSPCAGWGGGKCIAYMFLMEVEEELNVWPESSSRERVWIDLKEAEIRCKNDWMKDAVREAQRLLGGCHANLC
uniref:Nudix hydrolase domain-containing protein n=1 Tax=Polytomella parva TaxID=51329 RepID=A0A7S0YSW0_9CHLO|mmetsp:Transcript_7658/g.15021  ORF Transcript_7658/g.15021 Transcript_7658/m.15021 type:complete len:352 (+) Transcript_7658:108-1163(+)|eukprot:CAMPEP_0175087340 /NCGR_PEP_ID=MMETSP0052_2-20121109/29774_1 /TAXON_ID=51329 ORGANISM="Polytomella parva, Strain SAG 63-3" /NCGR_SAMPLE_ID=MMETSP0052_2 /ASSEMBLY_ACC=CAM_ASM_000194 /LENGTH=351 /DNA_ID=CAMNT_0016359671 /DNA_START=69 /DNA_END=1124 /DNA_ORIENTATION=-